MKNILITGANRGFGLALAHEFDRVGYGLYLVVRSETGKEALQRTFPNAHVLQCDITDSDYEATLARWLGDVSLQVVINNAGSGTAAPTLESTKTAFLRKEFETNCVAVLATVKGALPALRRAASAVVINITSRRGSLTMQAQLAAKGSGCSYSYRISKAAQNMLTLCLADDLEDENISVVAIHPGRLLTDMAASDACMSPQGAASKLQKLVEQGELHNRDYISLETGPLPW